MTRIWQFSFFKLVLKTDANYLSSSKRTLKVLDKVLNCRKTQYSDVICEIGSNLGNTRENNRKYPGMKF